MAGIIANSVSKQMSAGATTPDNSVTEYLVGEEIILTRTDVALTDTWGLSRPQGVSDRSLLSETVGPTTRFMPDAPGFYVVMSKSDYVLRISVIAVAQSTIAGALRLQEMAAASVPAPPAGLAVFTEGGALKAKKPDGSVVEFATV